MAVTWKRGTLLFAAPEGDLSIYEAKQYIKEQGLSRHQVAIVQVNGQILVEAKIDIEHHELGD